MILSRLSLRARITIGTALAAIVLLALSSVVVYARMTGIVEDRERAVLHGISAVYRSVITQDPAEPFEAPGVGQHVAIASPDGRWRMDTLPDSLRTVAKALPTARGELEYLDAGAAAYYVYNDSIVTEDGTWRIITARNSDTARSVLGGVGTLLIAVLFLGAAAFTLGAWAIATVALRPVERLRRSAESLAVESDHGLLPVGPARDGLSDLAGTLNSLLERMRGARLRERRMIADASHELRTPLALLQAQLSALDGGQRREEVRAAAETATRLSRITDSLLQLSRIDAMATSGSVSVEELALLLAAHIDRVRLRVTARAQPIDLDFEVRRPGTGGRIALSGDDFGRIMDNLVDNAVGAASDRRARILVSLDEEDGELVLTVADDAGGLDPEVAEHAFSRFVRGPRSGYAGGGLGLPIVAGLAELAGGTVALANRPGDGVSVTVRLPLSPG